MKQLETLLHHHGLRLTKPRQRVFDALHVAHTPLFMHQLTQACLGIDRSTVYRSLEQFVELGIVEIIHTGFKKRYELAGPFKPHHHHFLCEHCETLVDILTPELETLLATLEQHNQFIVTTHHFELRGVCKKCQTVV